MSAGFVSLLHVPDTLCNILQTLNHCMTCPGAGKRDVQRNIMVDDAFVRARGNLALLADGLLAMINSSTQRHHADLILNEAALQSHVARIFTLSIKFDVHCNLFCPRTPNSRRPYDQHEIYYLYYTVYKIRPIYGICKYIIYLLLCLNKQNSECHRFNKTKLSCFQKWQQISKLHCKDIIFQNCTVI